MDYSVPQFVTYVLAWFGLTGGTWALFEYAETVVNPKLHKRLSGWLTAETPIQFSDWPGMFASGFDRVFSEKHLSWRCFYRSAIVSVFSVFVVTFTLFLIPREAKGFECQDCLDSGLSLDKLLTVAITAVVLNILPDYLSLLETRLLLKWMSKMTTKIQIPLLILDAVFTSLIFAVSLWVILPLAFEAMGLGGWVNISLIGVFQIITQDLFRVTPYDLNINVYFFSTFSTSAWIWLFIGSGLIIRLLTAIGLSFRKIGTLFDVEKKPLRSMGFVSVVLVTGLFALLPFVLTDASKNTTGPTHHHPTPDRSAPSTTAVPDETP